MKNIKSKSNIKLKTTIGFIIYLFFGIINLSLFVVNIKLESAIGFILGFILGIIGLFISIFLGSKYFKAVLISFLILLLSGMLVLIYGFFMNVKLAKLAIGFIFGLFPGIISFFIFTKKITLESAIGFILGLLGIIGLFIIFFLGSKYFKAALLGFFLFLIISILVVFYGILFYY